MTDLRLRPLLGFTLAALVALAALPATALCSLPKPAHAEEGAISGETGVIRSSSSGLSIRHQTTIEAAGVLHEQLEGLAAFASSRAQ